MAEDFLSRWSRRKLSGARGEAEAQTHEAAAAEATAEDAEVAEVETAEREPHPAEDIDIDSLTRDSDFTVFMQKGVPAALKRKALRKLWTSDPVFANLDGLDDYFDIAKPKIHGMGPIGGTNWQIGRGFLTEEEVQRAMGVAEKIADAVPDSDPANNSERDVAAVAEEAEGEGSADGGEPPPDRQA